MPPELLLLSSTRVVGGDFLAYAREAVAELFAACRTVHFVPFAAAESSWDTYTETIIRALAPLNVRVIGVHTLDPRAAIESAEAVFVGGGNSFRLLRRLQAFGLVEPLRRRVATGQLRYLGASAGSNMACPSVRTTNDMPIVQPASFEALGLVPFQINPHFPRLGDQHEGVPTHMGETREVRINEFLQDNDVPVVGMREGAWLRRSGARLELGGLAGARLFRRRAEPEELEPPADLGWLLQTQPRFDVPEDRSG